MREGEDAKEVPVSEGISSSSRSVATCYCYASSNEILTNTSEVE